MKRTKVKTKKLLSIVLAVIMIMTSCSICFSSIAADDAIDALANVIAENKTVMSKLTYNRPAINNGSSTQEATTTIGGITSYENFQSVKAVFEALSAAVASTNAWTQGISYNGSNPSAKNCNDIVDVKNELVTNLSAKMDTNDYNQCNVATFLSKVFNVEGVYLKESRDNSNGIDEVGAIGSATCKDTKLTTTVAISEKAYLDSCDTLSEVKNDDALSFNYAVSMKRLNYSTGSLWNKKNYYYVALTNAATQGINAGITTSDIYEKLNGYNSYISSFSNRFNDTDKEAMENVYNGVVTAASYNEFNTKYNDILSYLDNANLFNKFFDNNAITSFIKTYADAVKVETFKTNANDWAEFEKNHPDYGMEATAENFANLDKTNLEADYESFMANYNFLTSNGTNNVYRDFFAEKGIISLEYYDNFAAFASLNNLPKLKEAGDAIYNKYNSGEEISEEEKAVDISELKGIVNSIAGYKEEFVNAIFTDGYDYLLDLLASLLDEEIETNEFVEYFAEAMNKTYLELSTKDIKELLDTQIADNYAGLKAYYEELGAVAETALGDFMARTDSFIDSLYNILAKRFEAQFAVVSKAYENIGSPTELDVKSYLQLKPIFETLDSSIYTYLESKDKISAIDSEVVEKYQLLKETFFDKFTSYKETIGLIGFEKTELEYGSRDVYANDKVKTEKYDVTEEKLLDTIENLDSLLASKSFASLIGIDGTLKDFLTGTVEDLIYSDSLINTFVNLLYPLIKEKFDDVWENKPTEVHTDVADIPVSYSTPLYTILKDVKLNIVPTTLADSLPPEYSAVKEKLKTANEDWKDPAIYDEEAGKLTINWGVDDAKKENKKDVFYAAFSAAMDGLKPLIMALLCGQDWSDSRKNAASALGLVGVELTLTASGNNGIVNALGPVFEALGYKDLPSAATINAYTDLQDVAKAIFEPIMAIVNDLAEKPVDSVLSILPNLVYALNFNVVPSILNMLNTTIVAKGYANAVIAQFDQTLATEHISVGDLFDLEEELGIDLSNGLNGILESFDINIPQIDTVTLSTLGTLTKMNTVRTDYIYNTQLLEDLYPSEAYTIEADKADVAYYVLTYVVNLLKNEEALRSLLSAIFVIDEPVDEEQTDVEQTDVEQVTEKKVDEEKVESIISLISSLDLKATPEVIAAAVELINAEKYPQAEFVYPEFITEEETEEPDENAEPAEEEEEAEAVVYTEYWTKEKAEYVSDNLVSFVVKFAGLLGYDINTEIVGVISNLYTTENVDKLVSLLNEKLLSKITDNESIMSIIDTIAPLLSIDVKAVLDFLSSYTAPEFEDGDRDAFVNALVDFVKPLVPVLKLLLVDSADNSELVIADAIEILGYNGYDSALIPVLEALGCDPSDITAYDEFIELDDEQMVRAVFNPILNLIDSISDDPINGIIELLPNILYFISYNGLQQAVDNLLRPVYVVLDVVRPIYNVDLAINLNLEEILTDLLAEMGLKSIGYSELSSMVQSLGTQTQYTSANGQTGVKLTVEESLTPDFITVLLRTAISTLIFSDNIDNAIENIRNSGNYDEKTVEEMATMLHGIADIAIPDEILFVLYYVFYGVNSGVEKFDSLTYLVSDKMKALFDEIGLFSSDDLRDLVLKATDILLELLNKDNGNGEPGSSSTTTSFFAKIIQFFQKLWDWFFKVFTR